MNSSKEMEAYRYMRELLPLIEGMDKYEKRRWMPLVQRKVDEDKRFHVLLKLGKTLAGIVLFLIIVFFILMVGYLAQKFRAVLVLLVILDCLAVVRFEYWRRKWNGINRSDRDTNSMGTEVEMSSADVGAARSRSRATSFSFKNPMRNSEEGGVKTGRGAAAPTTRRPVTKTLSAPVGLGFEELKKNSEGGSGDGEGEALEDGKAIVNNERLTRL